MKYEFAECLGAFLVVVVSFLLGMVLGVIVSFKAIHKSAVEHGVGEWTYITNEDLIITQDGFRWKTNNLPKQ